MAQYDLPSDVYDRAIQELLQRKRQESGHLLSDNELRYFCVQLFEGIWRSVIGVRDHQLTQVPTRPPAPPRIEISEDELGAEYLRSLQADMEREEEALWAKLSRSLDLGNRQSLIRVLSASRLSPSLIEEIVDKYILVHK